jgi:hypothetical protein
MIHPFEGNLSELNDTQLEGKLQELTKKYYTAQRLGKIDLLTQIATFITMYRDEMSRRNYSRLTDKDNGDLDQLINVD